MNKFDWNDITIVPATISEIASRKEINTLSNGKLPLFTAPMDMVISKANIQNFVDNNINICLPRNIKYDDLKDDNHFYAYGLDEIIGLVETEAILPPKVLIDVANGNMRRVYDIAKLLKDKFGDKIELMVGNIANPETFREYCEIGVDWVRVGIGGGCFHGDMEVLTSNGPKKIKDINLDDYVLTHSNKYMKVLQKHEFKNNSNIMNINNIKVTDNHEFYVINKLDKDIVSETNIKDYAYWVQAAFLDKEKHLLVKYS